MFKLTTDETRRTRLVSEAVTRVMLYDLKIHNNSYHLCSAGQDLQLAGRTYRYAPELLSSHPVSEEDPPGSGRWRLVLAENHSTATPASYSFSLTGRSHNSSRVVWSTSATKGFAFEDGLRGPIEASWFPPGSSARLAAIGIRASGQVFMRLRNLDDSATKDAGPHLIESVRDHLQIHLQSGSQTLTLAQVPDRNDPYEWVPRNQEAAKAFYQNENAGSPQKLQLILPKPWHEQFAEVELPQCQLRVSALYVDAAGQALSDPLALHQGKCSSLQTSTRESGVQTDAVFTDKLRALSDRSRRYAGPESQKAVNATDTSMQYLPGTKRNIIWGNQS